MSNFRARSLRHALAAGFIAGSTSSAFAQAPARSTDENALLAASDAFGTSVGRESIGLYSASDVRGFSPLVAGNVRIEGLYIDALALPNARLTSSSTIRVGISAQGYPFSAPTGIADYRLRVPGDKARGSLVLGGSEHGNRNIELNLELPLASSLSIGAGGVYAEDDKLYWGGHATHRTGAIVGRWTPSPNLEITPFASYFAHADEETSPRLVVATSDLPPEVPRETYYGQKWAVWTQAETNAGVVAKARLANWLYSGGLFRSRRDRDVNYSDQFLGVTADGRATGHRLVATPDVVSASTSGELRATRGFAEGPRRHVLHLSLSGRDQKRRYGGGSSVEFGPTRIDARTRFARPVFAFGRQSYDEIEQRSAGVGYQVNWRDRGEFSASVTKSRYSKATVTPAGALPDTTSTPWLYSGGLAVRANARLVVYGGMSRGLEESSAAPDVAVNRDEAPPAILTQQYDGGIRWDVGRGLRLVIGGFSIEKPYYNLDAGRVYRRLGDLRNRGIELSVSGSPLDNLTLLAGAILTDAEVTGGALALGGVGRKPVGATDTAITVNADYRVVGVKGLSVDAGVEFNGARVANTANTLSAPSTTVVNLGARYRFDLGGRPAVLRVQAANLLDDYGWEIIASNTLAHNRGREITARLTTEF